MSRSYKKNKITKQGISGAKKLGNRIMRRKTKSKLKDLDGDCILPIDKSEVTNDYDVVDWKVYWDEVKPQYSKLKGKNKRLNK